MAEVPLDSAFPGQSNGAGVATVGPVGPARAGEEWVIEQISVSGTVPAGTHAIASISINGLFKLGTRTGEFDTASQAPPIPLQAGETLTCTWSGLTPNTPVQLRITGLDRYR